MSDIVVTVPKKLWEEWLAEGDLPGEPWTGNLYFYSVPTCPKIEPGERVYIAAHGRLRGYSPLVRIQPWGSRFLLVRHGGAVAVTIAERISGFRGYRYRWWEHEEECPFPKWQEV